MPAAPLDALRAAASRIALALLLAAPAAVAWPGHDAWALSEIQREELPPPGAQPAKPAPDAPDADDAAESPDEGGTGTAGTETGDPERPDVSENGPVPPVEYDLLKLPEPVRRMHDLLIEACKSGDIEKLRVLLGTGEDATQVSLGGVDGDVIDFLKSSSGDGEGYEILAILQEILSAGYVHLDEGKPEELYVWPYFFGVPLDKLDGRQKVELFKLITAGDFEEMKTFGAYVFYRAGITPDGRWAFFLAGD